MARLNGLRVVIVGAGLAGLVAARQCARQGAAVHLVEARDRLGGRVLTLRADPISPFAVEAGGEFIDGAHTSLRRLARELDLKLVRVLREGFGLALDRDGRPRIYRRQERVWQSFKRALGPVAATLSEVECDWNSSIAASLAGRSVDALLTARGAPPDVREMAQALRGFFLADSTQLSALVGLELAMEDIDPGHVPLYRVRGGNDQLALALVRGLDVKISGRHVARAVHQTPGHVRVAVESPDGRRDFVHADYAIVTVPPPVLLSWEFDPPLPVDQRRAFEAIAYGGATKAILRFDSRWWRCNDRPRAYGTNLPTGAIWESAEEQRGAAFLTLLAGGSAGAALQDILSREGGDGIVRRIGWLGRPGALKAVEVVVWERDPWARGGYGYFSASFEPHLRDALARAFGRVLFAGDHTSRQYQGYMNGAVESGERVLEELIALETIRAITDPSHRRHSLGVTSIL